MASRIQLFLCYAHQDEALVGELREYLGALRRQRFFDIYDAREISAGVEWAREIDRYINDAHIILLFTSQYFINSDFCFCTEMERAIERHQRGEARVIPVILRPVFWKGTPFGVLKPLPGDGEPVTSRRWNNRDAALFAVAEGIRQVIEELNCKDDGGQHL